MLPKNIINMALLAFREKRLTTGIIRRLVKYSAMLVPKDPPKPASDNSVLFIPSCNSINLTEITDILPLRVALDMYVLGQGVKTGVYRVCEELFKRLAVHKGITSFYMVREHFMDGVLDHINNTNLPGQLKKITINLPSDTVDVLLSPFTVAPKKWLDDRNLVHAHIIYDLIAIKFPEFFTSEAVAEVRQIIGSLSKDTVVFAISECTKKDLLAFRTDLSTDQVVVIPLAIDDKFKPCNDLSLRSTMRDCYGIPANVPYVLSLATLEIRKNMEQVVRAFVLYCEENPQSNLHLVLAGMTGWKQERLKAEIEKADKWSSRIMLIGFVDDCDLAALYSDALCFIYLSHYEGFGLPPLEAMACGTTVICSNTSSLPEVVGDAGMLFGPDDTRGVANAIAELESSAALRIDFSAKGLARSAMFSWDNCCNIVVEKLQSAAKNRQRSAF